MKIFFKKITMPTDNLLSSIRINCSNDEKQYDLKKKNTYNKQV